MFERCFGGDDDESSLDLAMSLHVLAAIYLSLGRFEEAIPVLGQAIQVLDPPRGANHALTCFPVTCNSSTHFRCLDRWIGQSLAMKKGLRSRSKPWVTPIHASVKVASLNFRAFDLLNVDRIAIDKCVCCASLFSMRARERKERASERIVREVFGGRENEGK